VSSGALFRRITKPSINSFVPSDEDLDILLDRSPEAFAREQGWTAGLAAKGLTDEHTKDKISKGDKTAFEVCIIAGIPIVETKPHSAQVFVPDTEEDANNDLANMFAEDAASGAAA
jgi:hypothetical protein